jgi:hypothetical protein
VLHCMGADLDSTKTPQIRLIQHLNCVLKVAARDEAEGRIAALSIGRGGELLQRSHALRKQVTKCVYIVIVEFSGMLEVREPR